MLVSEEKKTDILQVKYDWQSMVVVILNYDTV